MQFASLNFVYFFSAVFALYWVLQAKWQNRMLLVASYFFYGFWDWRFLTLILISTLVDFFAGLKIHASEVKTNRKRWLWGSLATNLGILFAFKYFGFFLGSLETLVGKFGMDFDLEVMKIVLPVGISFYTFQTMSYTIDIYRRELEPTRNLENFALFVAFFPQLLSGPIERAGSLLKQIEMPRYLREPMMWTGIFWLAMGFYKKVVVAENLVPYTKPVFAEPRLFSSGEALMALYTGMVQVYCDFSGYSDIAIGLGALLGIRLTINFRQPLFANNPTQLWRKWHVTLYYWLRDYIYKPLIERRTFRSAPVNMIYAVLLTFFFAGLWHGADWKYIVWAMMLAILLIVHRLAIPVLRRLEAWVGNKILWRILGVVTFFHFWMIVSIYFAAPSLEKANVFLSRLFSDVPQIDREPIIALGLFALPLLIYEGLQEAAGERIIFVDWKVTWQFALIAGFFAAICFCAVSTVREFEYFQF